MKNAQEKTEAIQERLSRRGINLDFDAANELRRAELTLQRWAELECGDGNDHSSWAIERDETTHIPYMVTYPHKGEARRHKVADREKGALKRIARICKDNGLYFFHQTDPRGCALYISNEPITSNDYTNGIAIC